MTSEKHGAERRQFVRIKKNFIIRFSEKNNSGLKFEVSQIENISKGGLCFTSTTLFPVNLVLQMELRTPYVAETVVLEGTLLSSEERVKGLIFINHVKFNNVSPQALDVLERIEKYNPNSK